MDEESQIIGTELWKRYEPMVRNYARKRFGNKPDNVEEVVSNVAAAFCELCDSGEELEHPSSWFYLAAKNFVNREFDELNRQEKIKEKLIMSAEESVDYSVTMLDRIITEEMIEKHKDDILIKLKPKERELYKYVYTMELTYAEIADITNVSVAAVKQKVFRLNNKLREYVNDKLNDII